MLGGGCLVALLLAGAGGYAIWTSVAAMTQSLEEGRGPREHTDESFRVRVVAPGLEWELLSGELAASWSDEALVVLRSLDCNAGVFVRPMSPDATHAEALLSVYGASVTATPGTAVRGFTGATFELSDTEGPFATSFLHEGVLYRLEARDPVCRVALRGAVEILPGGVTPRWLRAPEDRAIGRSYRVRSRVFESAATGLVVDATEPFAATAGGAGTLDGRAELVVLHRDGVLVSLDPMLRTPAELERLGPNDADTIEEIPFLGETHRFVRSGQRVELSAYVDVAGLSVRATATGATTAGVRAALTELGTRVRRLSPDMLEALRAELATQIHERRSGEGWSLRDGTFRTYAPSGPTLALYVPRWSDVYAGLDARHTHEEGEVVMVRRRELGVTATVTVTPTTATDVTEALASYLETRGLSGAVQIGRAELDRVGRVRAEFAVDDEATGPRRLSVLVQVLEGTAFALGAWRHTPEHEDAARWVDEIAEGFVVEPMPAPSAIAGVHHDERIGFALHAPGATFSVEDTTLPLTESLASVCAIGGSASICVHAASDRSVHGALLSVVDRVGTARSPSAIWAVPPRATTLDDRPAMERVFRDRGEEVHLVSALVDRTVYVAVARNPPRGDWSSAFLRVDLDE